MELTRIRGAGRRWPSGGLLRDSDHELDTPSSTPRGDGPQVIVKNTFLTVVAADDPDASPGKLARSASDSDLASNSTRSQAWERESVASSRSRACSNARSSAGSDLPVEEDCSEVTGSSHLQSEASRASPAPAASARGGEAELQEEWSAGSALHATSQCRPCLYLHSETGCSFGAKCRFCHLSHKKKSRQRPCKTTRTECKRMVQALNSVFDTDQDKLAEVSRQMGAQSNYMRQLIRGQSKAIEGAASGAGGGGSASSAGASSTRLSL